MDKTKIYIKMCEKSTEIQKLRPNDLKSSYMNWFCVIRENGEPAEPFGFYGQYCLDYLEEVWLPRQEQLQKMLITDKKFIDSWVGEKDCKKVSLDTLIYAFYRESLDFDRDDEHIGLKFAFSSMEQLWLAFIMKEKYNKTWNGEDWVKE